MAILVDTGAGKMGILRRKNQALRHIQISGTLGLEIGPGSSPILQPSEANIEFVDHLDREGLIKKYAGDGAIKESLIPNIDYIWGNQTLRQMIGPNKKFDYALASHVIEHVPDLVSWLSEIHEILRPDGILSLVIPDKRFCFDWGRQTSKFSEVLSAYVEGRRRPSAGQILDHFSGVMTNDNLSAWSAEVPMTTVRRTYTDMQGLELAKKAFSDHSYVDVHCWVFVQESLVEILLRLSQLGLLKYEVLELTATNTDDCEFYVTLRAQADNVANVELQRQDRERSIHDAIARLGLKLRGDSVEMCNELMQGTGYGKFKSRLKRIAYRGKRILCLKRV